LIVLCSSVLVAQNQPQPKTNPASVNYIWKNVEKDFIALAQAMPEDKPGARELFSAMV
jgi:hypothetical protein